MGRSAKCFLYAVGWAAMLALTAGGAEGPPASKGPKASVKAAAPVEPRRADLGACWDLIGRAQWSAAVERLETLLESSPSPSPSVEAEAFFALGHIWQHRRPGADLARARRYYRRILDDHPRSSSAPWAMLTLARIVDAPEVEPKTAAERGRIRAEAQEGYRRVLAAFPDHMAADEAALRLAVTCLEQLGDAKAEAEGAAILHARLRARPGNYLAATMHTALGEYEQRRGRYREAVDHFIAAAEAGLPSMFHQAKACYRIARIAEVRLKDYDLAAAWYERMCREAPGDNRYYTAMESANRCRRLYAAARGEKVEQAEKAGEERP